MLRNLTENPWKKVGAISVGGLGLVIIAATLIDVLTDITTQREAVATTATENIPPLVLSLALVWVSQWLLTTASSRRYIYTVVRWTGIVFIGTIITAGWIALFRRIQGSVEPIFLFADVLAVVTLAGAIIGLYDAERTENQEKIRKERDRRDALIRSLADAAAEIEIENGTVNILNTNKKYDELFPDQTAPFPEEALTNHPTETSDGPAVSADGGVIERKVTRETKDGQRPFKLRSVPIEPPNGSQRRYVVYSDLTDSQQAQRRITLLEEKVETIAELQEIATDDRRHPPDRLRELLKQTRDSIGAEMGVLCKPFLTEDGTDRGFEVVAATDTAPVTAGETLSDERQLFRRLEAGPVQTLPANTSSELSTRFENEHVARGAGSFDSYETFIGGEVHVDGELYGVSCFGARKTTEFTRNDEALVHQLNQSLGVVVGRWKADRKLHDRSERLDVVASTVSHDFKNPIMVVQANARHTKRELEQVETEYPEEIWECLDRVVNGATRLDELSDDVVRLARDGQAIESPEPIDLAKLAQEAWQLVETEEARLVIDDDVGTVRGDGSRVERVFENLFQNAIEHGGADVTVTVGPLDEGGFYVSDDGDGFSEELAPADAFTRHRSGHEESTGLGLWLVDIITSAHGWEVHAANRDDGGARFEIRTGD